MTSPLQKGLFWVLTEGAAGMQSQAMGLAEAMGAEQILCHTIKLNGIWRTIAPYFRWGWKNTHNFTPPWPEVVVACGRKAILAALWLKKKHGIPVVYVQDPYISPRHFDAVVAPAHDNVKDARVINMVGACHRVSPNMLKVARETFAERFANTEKPRRSVFIGGPNRCFDMPVDPIRSLIQQLQQEPGSLWVTVSRRTPPEIINMLREQSGLTLITPEDDPNPYMGLLAWSDICILTCDSVNMASEAIAAGVPLYLVRLPGGNKKFQRFHDEIEKRGLIRWWRPGKALEAYAMAPLDEMSRVAQCVNQRLGRLDSQR